MANFFVLTVTNTKAIVKVIATSTIHLATDILVPAGPGSETVLTAPVPTVNILGVMWTGAAASTINVTRNSESILDIFAQAAQSLFFNQQNEGFVDNRQNTSDIVVTISGAAELYLLLRKVAGYKTSATIDQLGSHGVEGV